MNKSENADSRSLLSIIVPVYNVEPYIRSCLDSVRAQTYQNFECILVDDGSVDGSGTICDEYARRDGRFMTIHQDNAGVSIARTVAVKASHGDFLGFLDPDDWIKPCMYEQLMEAFQSREQIDISIGGYLREYKDGTISMFMPHRPFICDAAEARCHMFNGKIFDWSLCDKVYRRGMISISKLLNNWTQVCGGDTVANWVAFHEARQVAYAPIFGYHYCLRQGSITQARKSQIKLSYMDMHSKMIEEAISQDESPYLIKALVQKLFRDNGLSVLRNLSEEYEQHAEALTEYSRLLICYAKRFSYQLTERDKRFLQRLARGKEVCLADSKRREMELARLVGKHREIWIYGAGSIGRETAAWLGKQGVPYAGFMVTSRSKKGKEELLGHPVYACREIFTVAQEAPGVVFAMNQNNFDEAFDWAKYCAGEKLDYMNDGVYSDSY